MKLKKRSTQKRECLLKRGLRNSILQHGGGFMDIMTSLNATEGHSYSSMSVHSTKPLIVTGNNTGELILWKINTESPPKKLAVLIGLPSAVKFAEFHKTLPIIAAGCSDKVLMWRWRYQEEEGQEDVQQLQPSHTVFSLKIEADLKREIDEVNTNLKQMEQIIDKLYDEKDALKGNENPIYLRRKEIYAEIESKTLDIKKNKIVLKNLIIELENLRKNLQNEVSCIAFHPNQPYIAVGLNNKTTNVSSRFVMYTFDPESESIKASYDIIPEDWSPRNGVDVLMASFSSDGNMFAYIVIPIDSNGEANGEGRVTAQNFYTDVEVEVEPYTRNQKLELFERKTYRIENRSITCITPYKSIPGYHDGTRYEISGVMMKHEFLIGCHDGSLRLIDVITVHPSRSNVRTRVEAFINVKEWNSGSKINCLAIHPLLPLFASGSRDAAQLWAFESHVELETLPLQPASPLSCVGFNYKFLAVCGSGGVRVYSNSDDDYRGYVQTGQKISDFTTELTLLNQQGDDCSICLQPMNDPPTQPAIRSGPEEIQEGYLTCGHKFHKSCIKDWFKDGKTTCPFCRKEARLDPLLTPDKFGEARKLLKYQQAQQGAESIVENFKRRGRYVPHGYVPHVLFGEPAAAPESVAHEEAAEPRRLRKEQEQRSENSGGGIKNKYSRKKYNSKKSKIRRHYSKKNNKK
jgi:WD40 repeat protein